MTTKYIELFKNQPLFYIISKIYVIFLLLTYIIRENRTDSLKRRGKYDNKEKRKNYEK